MKPLTLDRAGSEEPDERERSPPNLRAPTGEIPPGQERVMDSVTRFITGTLRLRVNQSKRGVARPWERKFLGFSFTADCNPRRRFVPQTVQRFRRRVRGLTRRTRGVNHERMVEGLARYWRGWLGYSRHV